MATVTKNRTYGKIASYRNIRRKILKFGKFDEKRAITPRWVIRFFFKIAG
jgi:hypothetical protein